MCDKSDWDRYKIRYEPNLSNVLNPERIDITLARMIISQIQTLVERYLIHRLPNNRAESHIRPFATHRRAWLFADTQAGARANATAYSLLETARSYDLNVYEYLKHVLTRMPALDHQNHPERLEELVPWSTTLPAECYRKNNPEKDSNIDENTK